MIRWASLFLALWCGAAQATTVLCVTRNPSSKDWVPKQVLVEVDSARLEAAVLDEYTLDALGGPVRVTFEQTGPKRLQFKWRLVGATDRQGRK